MSEASGTANSNNLILMKNLTDSHLIDATVFNIEWERVTVYLDIKVEFSKKADKKTPLIFYAINGDYKARAVFRTESVNGNVYRVSLNVTNPGNARCVPTGNYTLAVCQGEDILAIVETDVELALKLQEVSRNFLYSGKARRSTYAVTFLVKEWAETLPFLMHILPPGFMKVRMAGFLAGCVRKKNLEQIYTYLGDTVNYR